MRRDKPNRRRPHSDFIRVDELDHLSDSNLSMLTLAIQEGAPELVEAWHVILAELVGP